MIYILDAAVQPDRTFDCKIGHFRYETLRHLTGKILYHLYVLSALFFGSALWLCRSIRQIYKLFIAVCDQINLTGVMSRQGFCKFYLHILFLYSGSNL